MCLCWSYGRMINSGAGHHIWPSTSSGPPMFASSVEIVFNLLSKLLARCAYALRSESLIL